MAYIGMQNLCMTALRKISLVSAAFLVVISCSHKRKRPSMSGGEKVSITDFIDYFRPLPLPAQFTDSVLVKKEKDSLLIGYNVFTQFVPDSVVNKLYGKGVKPKIYSIGKISPGRDLVYVLTKMVTADKKILLVSAFDGKRKFISYLPALRMDQQVNTKQSVLFDRKMGITKSILRKNKDGSMSEGKDVYVLYEQSGAFMLIMTDALEEKPAELINPIDTLSRKHKYAADYGTGKTNLVSIRDGRKNDRLTFYIHVERNNGDCVGELKGEALLRTASTAEYRADGDPCILKFTFSPGAVSLREESCGSHRGVHCLFDGSFARRKDTRPKEPAKKRK